MKLSLLITAYKEEESIKKLISSILSEDLSFLNDDFEILIACPDKETFTSAIKEAEKFNQEDKLKWVIDKHKGKPAALNMLIQQARGEVWIFTDGDVYFDNNAISNIFECLKNKDVQIVTGRPISSDSKNKMMGYFGHLLADAAHHKRTIDLKGENTGRSSAFVKTRKFFPVSGYLFAIRKNSSFEFPNEVLADDAYISYIYNQKGKRIYYCPDARVFVKYPKNLKDYFIQKKRSAGGYVQLWDYGVVTRENKSRSFWRELEYFWYPITYASNLKELFWSLMLYPIRFWQWIMIYWERKIIKKDFAKTWSRVDSTK